MGIFLVERPSSGPDEKPRVVEAKTRAGAIAHVVKSSYAASIITAKRALELGKLGFELETAGEEIAPAEGNAE